MQHNSRIAFVGLGRMGSKMCELLLKAGYSVSTAVHHNPATAERFARDYGLAIAPSVAAAVADADVVFTMLPSDKEVREVLHADGFAESLKPGAILVDLSSVSRSLMQEAETFLKGFGVALVDCPVSGPAGTCMMLASGDPAAVEKARPVLEAMGREILYCGAAGTGSFFKSLNNLMLSVNVMAAAECAEVIRENPEIDPELFVKAIRNSSGYSNAFESSFLPFFIHDNDAVTHEFWSSCKDMRNGLDEIGSVPTPVFSLCYQLMRLNFRHDHDNWSSIIKLYRGE